MITEKLRLLRDKVINRLPGDFLLKSATLGDIYVKSEIHKYKARDILMLKYPDWSGKAGYGRRPILSVLAYEMGQLGERRYKVENFQDGSLCNGEDPSKRVSHVEYHFKWNIENHFVPVPSGMSVENAAKLYEWRPR